MMVTVLMVTREVTEATPMAEVVAIGNLKVIIRDVLRGVQFHLSGLRNPCKYVHMRIFYVN